MKKLLFVVCLCASSAALAEPAAWTGNKEQIEVDGDRIKWNCEYRVPGTTDLILFWRAFYDACPAEVEYF